MKGSLAEPDMRGGSSTYIIYVYMYMRMRGTCKRSTFSLVFYHIQREVHSAALDSKLTESCIKYLHMHVSHFVNKILTE